MDLIVASIGPWASLTAVAKRLANRVVKGETGPVILRRLSPDDWLLWREVRLRALEDSPDAFGATLSEWGAAGEDRWRSRLGTVPFNVVAVLGDDPVGQASGTELGDDGRVELVSMSLADRCGPDPFDTCLDEDGYLKAVVPLYHDAIRVNLHELD
jgi:hypothetical protein